MKSLSDGDTWVYEFEKHPFLDASNVVWWWLVGLKRFDESEITLVSNHFSASGGVMVTSKDKSKDRDNQPEFKGFVNINLSDEEYDQIDAVMTSKKLPELGVQLDYLLEVGKVSLSYVRGSMNVTITFLSGENVGIAVTAYSDTMLEAVLLLRMKVQNYGTQLPALLAGGGVKRKRG